MGVLYALESIRTPALDKIMSVITLLGGELFFMVIAVTVFWCVSKREGYYLMIVGFFGTVINQFLKILCCVPRPWIKDPDFTIVESARAEATGYSFPSGHTQNAVATYGGIARYTRRGWLRVVLVVLTVLIAFSRMYLGVHTPLDVGVSFLIAAVLVLVVYPLMEEADRRPVVLTYTILAMVVCSGAFVGYLYLRGDTGAAAEDTANYVSALENGWKLLGATLGMLGAAHQAGSGLWLSAGHTLRAESAADRAAGRQRRHRRGHPLPAGGAVRRVRVAADLLVVQSPGEKMNNRKSASPGVCRGMRCVMGDCLTR